MILKNKHYVFLGVLFLLIAIANFLVAYYDFSPYSFLWFCSAVLLLFSLGLFLKSSLLISGTVTASFLIEFLWTTDMISFLLRKKLAVGIAMYLFEAGDLRFIITFYHLFLLIVPILIVFNMKKFHKYSWIAASVYFLLISVITVNLTSSNVNCVQNICNLGVFNFLKLLNTGLIANFPAYIFNWVFITIILFMPTHYLFRYIVDWVSKE